MRINLGDVARDKITGFQGIVVARTKWLRNCDRLTIQPRELHDGKPIESQTFDEPDLAFVEHSEVCECEQQPAEVVSGKTGGPRSEPTRRR